MIINFKKKQYEFKIDKYSSIYSLKNNIKNKIEDLEGSDFYLMSKTKILEDKDPVVEKEYELKIRTAGGNFKNPKNSVIAISMYTLLYSIIGNLYYTFYLGKLYPEDPIDEVKEFMKRGEKFKLDYDKNNPPKNNNGNINENNAGISDAKKALKKTQKIFKNIKNQPWGKMLSDFAIDRKWPACQYDNGIEFSPTLVSDSSFLSKITYSLFMTFMLLVVFCSFFVLTSKATCGVPKGSKVFVSLLFLLIPLIIVKIIPITLGSINALINGFISLINYIKQKLGKKEIEKVNLYNYSLFTSNIFILLFFVILYIINAKILSPFVILVIVFNFIIGILLKLEFIQGTIKSLAIWLSNFLMPGFTVTSENADCSVLYRYMFSFTLVFIGFIFNFGLWFLLIYKSLEKSCGFKIF